MAASPHSWDFLLLRLRELRLPLLRGSGSGTSGPTAKSIADILPSRGYQSKISCSASPPIRGDVQALCGSGTVVRDAETNNDRGEHCMSDFVFPSSLWFSQLTPKLSRGLAIATRRQDRRLERLVGHGYSSNS